MKNQAIYLTCLTAFLTLLYSCSSAKVSLYQNSPIVLLTVCSNSSVPWDEDRDEEYQDLDGLITKGINSVLGKNNPEIQSIQERLDYAQSSFENLLFNNAQIEVIQKKDLITSQSYQELKPDLFGFASSKSFGEGYKKIEELNSLSARKLLKELNAKSYVVLDFNFNKKIIDGSKLKGRVSASIKMNVDFYNERGKNILSETFYAISEDSIEIEKMYYDKEELVNQFPELIDLVINQFIVKYL